MVLKTKQPHALSEKLMYTLNEAIALAGNAAFTAVQRAVQEDLLHPENWRSFMRAVELATIRGLSKQALDRAGFESAIRAPVSDDTAPADPESRQATSSSTG